MLQEHIEPVVRRNFEEMKAGRQSSDSRSILSLSLQGYDSLTAEVLAESCDQIKTFLFAGHDSTSTAITWMIYELSRTPHALRKVREELDNLLGPGCAREPQAIRDKLLGPHGESLVNRMTYISAVMKESLRMHSPAGTIRISHPGTGFSVETSQGDYNLDGNWIYVNHNIIHFDENVYGDTVGHFIPERWLQPDAVPASAWRAFERGPRNCIGQELATIEARVIIAMVAYRYDFVKIGIGEVALDDAGRPTLDHKGQYTVKSELYNVSLRAFEHTVWRLWANQLQTIQITGRPVDGMMMKVKMNEESD
jgi:cytochrome P450